MSVFTILFTKHAQRDAQKLPPQIAKRIHNKLVYFTDSGKPLAFAESLAKPADAQYRWRVGNYRILFDADEAAQTITILKIQHRKDVYRK